MRLNTKHNFINSTRWLIQILITINDKSKFYDPNGGILVGARSSSTSHKPWFNHVLKRWLWWKSFSNSLPLIGSIVRWRLDGSVSHTHGGWEESWKGHFGSTFRLGGESSPETNVNKNVLLGEECHSFSLNSVHFNQGWHSWLAEECQWPLTSESGGSSALG